MSDEGEPPQSPAEKPSSLVVAAGACRSAVSLANSECSKAWTLPKEARDFSVLPVLDQVTPASLLSFHAHHLLFAGGFPLEPPLKRLRGKQKVNIPWLLYALRRSPDVDYGSIDINWIMRRDACWQAAAVLAAHYPMGLRGARVFMQKHWPSTEAAVKANYHHLGVMFGKPDVMLAPAADDVDMIVETPGAMLTWHTSLGRKGDTVARLFEVGAATEDIEVIAANDQKLKCRFDAFVDYVAERCEEYNLEYWSASMELCAPEAQTGRIHLHAYVCRNWRLHKTPAWSKVKFASKWWVFDDVIPHLKAASLRPNMNPQRALTTGLYYLLCPKVGSIYRRSNLQLWKDPCRFFLHSTCGSERERASHLPGWPLASWTCFRVCAAFVASRGHVADECFLFNFSRPQVLRGTHW